MKDPRRQLRNELKQQQAIAKNKMMPARTRKAAEKKATKLEKAIADVTKRYQRTGSFSAQDPGHHKDTPTGRPPKKAPPAPGKSIYPDYGANDKR